MSAVDESCGEKVQGGRGEGPGELGKESGSVPGADVDGGVAAIGFVVPVDDRSEGFVAVGQLHVHEAMDHGEIAKNGLRAIQLKIAGRQVIKMSFEFLVAKAGRRQTADLLGQQFPLPGLGPDEIRSSLEHVPRLVIQGPHAGIL